MLAILTTLAILTLLVLPFVWFASQQHPGELPSQWPTFGDGLYRVGSEIAPGTYRTNGHGGRCYWARLDSLDASPSVTLDEFDGPGVVDIQPTDTGVEFRGGCMWARE